MSQTQTKTPPRSRIRYGGIIAGNAEIEAVTEVLKGQGWGQGEVTLEFERAAARFQNRKYSLFVNSGSSSLLLALATLPKGSFVAMPALQFPTLYSAAIWCGLRPVLIDCDDSLNMDPKPLVHHSYLDAVVFVHMAGNPTNIIEVKRWCERYNLKLIEDNCEGFGGTYDTTGKDVLKGDSGRQWTQTGSFGDISCTSTHAAHHISTGGGGLVFTDDEQIYEKMRRLRDWGRAYGTAEIPGYYENYVFSELGFNLQATDIQAALGIVQLKRLGEFTSRRRENYADFAAGLKGLPITLPRVADEAYPSWFCFPLLCDDRDALYRHLTDAGIEARTILVGSLLRQPLGIDGRFCPVADDVFRRGLWFSVHPRLSREDKAYIVQTIREFYES